jgi:manganese transport protein
VLTSSEKVMGKFKNTISEKASLWLVGIIVTLLNLILFADLLGFIRF